MSQTVTIESGTVVIDVAAPTTQLVTAGTSSAPTVINRDGALTVALVSGVVVPSPDCANGLFDNTQSYVQLPSDASVGDVVEVYDLRPPLADHCGLTWGGSTVLLPSGETLINEEGSSDSAGVYRKLTSTQWGLTRSP
jgi:hypothetical protein